MAGWIEVRNPSEKLHGCKMHAVDGKLLNTHALFFTSLFSLAFGFISNVASILLCYLCNHISSLFDGAL